MLVSNLPKDKVESKKIDYYNVGRINVIEESNKDLINEIKGLLYKSSKVIMSNRQTYSSYPKYEKKSPSMGNFEPIEKTQEFFDDLDHFHVIKKLD